MGLMRNPQGRRQYDSLFFRNHCEELLKTPILLVQEFIENHYRLCCLIGLENSPARQNRHRKSVQGSGKISMQRFPARRPRDESPEQLMQEISIPLIS
jgi:predicted secreted protein